MNVIDKGSRYDYNFAIGFVAAIGGREWSSPNFYSSCLVEKCNLKDSDVNPYEDYIMVARYFEGKEVQMIAVEVGRTKKCVTLRLMFLLNIRNEVFLNRNGMNLSAVNLIISALYSRYCSFRAYLRSIIYGDEEKCAFYPYLVQVMEGEIDKEGREEVIIDENTFIDSLTTELSDFEFEFDIDNID